MTDLEIQPIKKSKKQKGNIQFTKSVSMTFEPLEKESAKKSFELDKKMLSYSVTMHTPYQVCKHVVFEPPKR
jgi:hypothetical protein